MFALGSIDPLLDATFDSFVRPNTAQLVSLLGDGSTTDDQVLQQGSSPFRQGSITATITELADYIAIRGYAETHEEVDFRDGNGTEYTVRVLDFDAKDQTGWWDISATLLRVSEVEPGS